MCFGLGLLSSLTGAKKQAKIARQQAEDQKRIAEAEALQSREIARGANLAREGTMRADQAAREAAELLNVPVAPVTVQVGREAQDVQSDPITGRRRTARSTFQMARPQSGLRI